MLLDLFPRQELYPTALLAIPTRREVRVVHMVIVENQDVLRRSAQAIDPLMLMLRRERSCSPAS